MQRLNRREGSLQKVRKPPSRPAGHPSPIGGRDVQRVSGVVFTSIGAAHHQLNMAAMLSQPRIPAPSGFFSKDVAPATERGPSQTIALTSVLPRTMVCLFWRVIRRYTIHYFFSSGFGLRVRFSGTENYPAGPFPVNKIDNRVTIAPRST